MKDKNAVEPIKDNVLWKHGLDNVIPLVDILSINKDSIPVNEAALSMDANFQDRRVNNQRSIHIHDHFKCSKRTADSLFTVESNESPFPLGL